jgi:hypothetical protein
VLADELVLRIASVVHKLLVVVDAKVIHEIFYVLKVRSNIVIQPL